MLGFSPIHQSPISEFVSIGQGRSNRRQKQKQKNLHLIVGVKPLIPQSLPHLRDEDLALLILPAHNLGQQEEAESLQATIHKHLHKLPNLLQLGVEAPSAHGKPELPLGDVDEARFAHVIPHARANGDLERLTHLLASLLKDTVPAVDNVLGVGDDVRMGADVELEVLEPAARLEVGEGLLVQGRPAIDATVEIADVDVVEVVRRPGPFQLSIIHVKFAVWRHPCWLNGGDIGADDLSRGELVGEISSKPRVSM